MLWSCLLNEEQVPLVLSDYHVLILNQPVVPYLGAHARQLLSPRPPSFPLRTSLALLLSSILITPGADLAADDRAGIVLGAVGAFGLAFHERGEAFAGFGDRFFRDLAGGRLFGAADGHFVECVAAKEGGALL